MRAGWAATILAFVMAIIGIVLTIGGIWLVSLGGSIYYLIAGILMLASAWFLFRGRLLGGWIYIGLFILSAIWGFAESRGNAWAMVPWLIAPLVILVWTLLVMPTLAPREGRRWGFAWGGVALGIVFVAASFAILGTTGGMVAAQLPAEGQRGDRGDADDVEPADVEERGQRPAGGFRCRSWRQSSRSTWAAARSTR